MVRGFMITIRQFTAADIPFGMALKEQAGWNQVAADWQRLLRLEPHGGFVAEWNGQPAGTVMVTRFDSVAWISMMLVEKAFRGRGIGRKLMEAALDFADKAGVTSVRLDATALGQPLYERLGFRADYSLVRHAGVPQPQSQPGEIPTIPVEKAAEIDRLVTGTNRLNLLSLLNEEHPIHGIILRDKAEGFVTLRPGSHATQIGPCCGDDSAGPLLLSHALQRCAGRTVFMDVPASHLAAAELATRHGLSATRTLLRMTRGMKVVERLEWMWTTFGPEKG
jgi:GNAT superfamily N-acetyltransferase